MYYLAMLKSAAKTYLKIGANVLPISAKVVIPDCHAARFMYKSYILTIQFFIGRVLLLIRFIGCFDTFVDGKQSLYFNINVSRTIFHKVSSTESVYFKKIKLTLK